MRVYLCGGINGCSDSECKDWREAAKAALQNVECVDPMRRDFRGREDDCAAEIVEGDKADIQSCDVVLVNYPKPSTGTDMEVLFAWERAKAVIAVVPPGAVISPWLKYHSHYIVYNFASAYDLINQSAAKG